MTVREMANMATQRVADFVRTLIPHQRYQMTPEESDLAILLLGNDVLYKALTDLIRTRITGRAAVPEPSDPLVCKSMLARDRELQWLLGKLEFLYHSPVSQPGDDVERPA